MNKKIIFALLLLSILVPTSALFGNTSRDPKRPICTRILDSISPLEGKDIKGIEIANMLFENEKINLKIETSKGVCEYGVGILHGTIAIVSNKPFEKPTIIAYTDYNTFRMLMNNPSQELLEAAIRQNRIRIRGTGLIDGLKTWAIDLGARVYAGFGGKKPDSNQSTDFNFMVMNFYSPDDLDGDGISNSKDECDPYIIKKEHGDDGIDVVYYDCPTYDSQLGTAYTGSSPYSDIYDTVMENGCGVRDTDGGKRYYVKGSICVEKTEYEEPEMREVFGQAIVTRAKAISRCEIQYTDYCQDEHTLVEYYYRPPSKVVVNHPRLGRQVVNVSGGVESVRYNCPFGCSNGACIVTDLDSLGYPYDPAYQRGELRYGFNPWTSSYYGATASAYVALKTGKGINQISQNDFFGDECIDNNTLREYYLTIETFPTSNVLLGGWEDRAVIKSDDYICPHGCINNECNQDGDFNIVSAEPVQVVYSQPGKNVPLIKGKGTAFRVIVNSTFNFPIDVDFRLDLPSDQWEVPANYPSVWKVTIPSNAKNFEVMLPVVQTGNENSEVTQSNPAGLILAQQPATNVSANSVLGPFNVDYRNVPRPIADKVSFTVEINPNHQIGETNYKNNSLKIENIDVETTMPLKLMFFIHVWGNRPEPVPGIEQVIDVQHGLIKCTSDSNEIMTIMEAVDRAVEKAKENTEYALGVSPIADRKIQYAVYTHVYAIEDFKPDGKDFSDDNVKHEAKVEYLSHIKSIARSFGYDYAISLNPCTRGGQSIGRIAVLVGAHPDAPSSLIGHELLSHQICRFHEECYLCNPHNIPSNACCETCQYNDKNCPQGYEWCGGCDVDCNSCVASDGFWVNKWKSYKAGHWENKKIVDAKYYACGDIPVNRTWQRIEPLWKYNKEDEKLPGGYFCLIDKFRSKDDPEVIVVSGIIYKNGTAKFKDFWITESFADLSPETKGEYYIVFYDSEGKVLARYGFDADFQEMGEKTKELSSTAFVYRVPWDEKTKKIELQDNSGNVLASRFVSNNRPEVSVLTPEEGNTFKESENIVIKWIAEDIDGDQLTFAIGLSQDKEKWVPLASNLKEKEYLLKASSLSRGYYWLKVIASDGVNTAEAISGKFFVDVPEAEQKKEICGNGICKLGLENSISCPLDCPTGIEDGICDFAKDNKVDPDCEHGDPDDTESFESLIEEEHAKQNIVFYPILAVVVLVLILVAWVVIKILRKLTGIRKHGSKKEKDLKNKK